MNHSSLVLLCWKEKAFILGDLLLWLVSFLSGSHKPFGMFTNALSWSFVPFSSLLTHTFGEISIGDERFCEDTALSARNSLLVMLSVHQMGLEYSSDFCLQMHVVCEVYGSNGPSFSFCMYLYGSSMHRKCKCHHLMIKYPNIASRSGYKHIYPIRMQCRYATGIFSHGAVSVHFFYYIIALLRKWNCYLSSAGLILHCENAVDSI